MVEYMASLWQIASTMMDFVYSVLTALYIGLDTLIGYDWFDKIASGTTVLIFGFFISGRVSRLVRRYLSGIKRFDRTLVPVLGNTTRYLILIVTIVLALSNYGVDTTTLIAVLGAAGIAIGLALQGTLSNVAAGVMILFLRPFKIGDWVETGGQSGSVTEIDLFATEITTFDNIYISVPNSVIWGATIINHARNPNRRMDVDIGIGYDSDFDIAEKTLLGLAKDTRVLAEPPPRFIVVSYGDSAIVVRLRLYARYDDFFELNWDIMRKLKPALDRAGISIPFPQRDINITPASAPMQKTKPKTKTKKTRAKKTKR